MWAAAVAGFGLVAVTGGGGGCESADVVEGVAGGVEVVVLEPGEGLGIDAVGGVDGVDVGGGSAAGDFACAVDVVVGRHG